MSKILARFSFLQRIKETFRALRHRNYRLFFGGQTVSLIGTWMQQVAIGWLVYRLTNSAFLLGVVGFASQIPTFIFSPIAGVFADRMNRHRLIIATQVLSMLQAFLLAAAVLTENVNVWHIILLSLFLGFINAFDSPIRQSFIVELIANKEDLGNAIALNSLMVNGTRMIGPALAGVLIATVGEGLCFLLNGLSYLFVIGALLVMKINPLNKIKSTTQVVEGLKEGFRYAFGFEPIRAILLLLALVSLLGFPYIILMPVFARDILHGGPNTLGFLMASVGIGALLGALYLAARKTVYGLGRLIAWAVTVFGLALIAFSFSQTLMLSMVLLFLVGFGMMAHIASTNTFLQTIVPDDKRGRLMSFYAVAFLGMAPFGSLIIGGIAHKIGAPYAVTIGGFCCLIAAFLYHRKLPELRKQIYPIYTQLGISPKQSGKR